MHRPEKTIRVGVVGYGYWGPHVVRNLIEAPGLRVSAVADMSPQRLEILRLRHPSMTTSRDAHDVIQRDDIDAIAIATPVNTHFELARSALEAGKHVLIEKPIAASSGEARALIDLANGLGLTLMVGHTFIYTGAVRKIAEIVRAGLMGEILYYDSVRVNLGLFQSDVNVLWDLAVHDLAIVDLLMPAPPVGVSALGVSHVAGQPMNIAYLTLLFPDNRIAHLHVNWLAPVKVRRTLIGGQDRMIVYDDLEPSEKVMVYDKGAELNPDPETKYRMFVSYRYGDMWAPNLDNTEGLHAEVMHFADCIRTGERPLSDGASGLRVVRILEAAEASIAAQGTLIPLPPL
jgi:predicted dehydrogenase